MNLKALDCSSQSGIAGTHSIKTIAKFHSLQEAPPYHINSTEELGPWGKHAYIALESLNHGSWHKMKKGTNFKLLTEV